MHTMNVTQIIVVCAVVLTATSLAQKTVYFKSSLRTVNPLRGFATYEWEGSNEPPFPTQLEYKYIAMKDLMPNSTAFDFSALNSFKQGANARGRQVIFRIYLDYPDCCPDGEYNTGVPSWLTVGANPVTFKSYSEYGGGQSPDYSNTRLLAAMKALIEEMGKIYDGDAGIAFIQVGLLGFWGEWHTYPYDGDSKPNYFATLPVQNEIISAFAAAFNDTQVLVSADQVQYWENAEESTISTSSIGWHDDNFCVATFDSSNTDWHFYPRLVARNMQDRWKKVVIGGEIQPGIQQKIFDSSVSCSDCQNFAAAVNATHATWLLFNDIFSNSSGILSKPSVVAAATIGSQQLGYQIYLKSAKISPIDATKCARIEIVLENIGSAPFYYPLSLAIQVNNGRQITISDTVNKLLPGSTMTFSLANSCTIFSPGEPETVKLLTVTLKSNYILPSQRIAFSNEEINSDGQVVVNATSNSPIPSESPSESIETSSAARTMLSSIVTLALLLITLTL